MTNPADVLAVARHVGVDDVPWVPNLNYPGTEMRLLQADLDAGVYTLAGRMHAGLTVGTHRHLGAVHMFTLSGSWVYLEHDFVNRAGSYLHEAPASVHTLSVPADNTQTRETLTVVYGRTEYIGDGGEVIAVSDTASNLAMFYESCEAAGIPRPTAILK